MKYRPLSPAHFLVAVRVSPTMARVTSVRGMLRITMETSTLTMVITLLIIWGMLWLSICRRVSISLV